MRGAHVEFGPGLVPEEAGRLGDDDDAEVRGMPHDAEGEIGAAQHHALQREVCEARDADHDREAETRSERHLEQRRSEGT